MRDGGRSAGETAAVNSGRRGARRSASAFVSEEAWGIYGRLNPHLLSLKSDLSGGVGKKFYLGFCDVIG